MYSKSQILNMDRDHKYASSSWIKNKETLDNNTLYTLYATNKASISSGRSYIALPSKMILTSADYLKYDIMK